MKDWMAWAALVPVLWFLSVCAGGCSTAVVATSASEGTLKQAATQSRDGKDAVLVKEVVGGAAIPVK